MYACAKFRSTLRTLEFGTKFTQKRLYGWSIRTNAT